MPGQIANTDCVLFDAVAAVAGPDTELKKFTRAGCDNFTGDVWQLLRPAYHITVPYGWMNGAWHSRAAAAQRSRQHEHLLPCCERCCVCVRPPCLAADPHGMFQLNDTVHLFFQYNPAPSLGVSRWSCAHPCLTCLQAAQAHTHPKTPRCAPTPAPGG